MQKSEPTRQHMTLRKKPIMIYLVMVVGWIILSTPLMDLLPSHPYIINACRFLFYVVSASILLVMLLTQQSNLRRSEDQYFDLLHTLREPIVLHWDNVILDVNDYAVELLQAKHKDELIGKSIFDIIHPDDLPAISHRVSVLRNGQSTPPLEQRFFTLTGQIRDVEVAAVKTTYRGGPAILAIIHDLTTQRRSERQLRTLIHAIPDFVGFIDGDGKWIEANHSMTKMFGLPKDFHGKTTAELAQFCKPTYRSYLLQASEYDASIQSEQTIYQYEEALSTGELRYYEIVRVPVQGEDGTPEGLVIVARDLSEERAMIRKLQRSEQRYRQVFESMMDAIFVVVDDKIRFVNRVAIELVKASSRDNLLGVPIHDVILNDQPGIESHTRRLRTFQGDFVEIDLHQSDIEFMNEPAVLLSVRDVTEQRHAEELLMKSERLSTAGQLAAGIAHEIRNPLTSLKGFLQLINHGATDNLAYYCAIMDGELSRIELIVNEFLILTKSSVLDMQPNQIREIVEETVGLLTAEGDFRGIRIYVTCDTDIPRMTCDKNRLKQVLVNLVKNALDAVTHAGEINIQVKFTSDNQVSITVRDNGVGIPKEQLDKIGEPFFTTKPNGTGLGLMISHKIIQDHGGKLLFTSVVGEGTTAQILLPIHPRHQSWVS